MTLDNQLKQACTLMANRQWAQAEASFARLAKILPSKSAIWQNLALCLLSQGKAKDCLGAAQRAITTDPTNWKAKSLAIKALRAQGLTQAALQMLEAALKRHPDTAALRMDGVTLFMNDVGDAQHALRLIPKDKAYREDAMLTSIVAGGYDRPDSAQMQVLRVKAFSQQYIVPWALSGLTPQGAPKSPRPRVGLISPFFGRTPVYYLAIGSLTLLAPDIEFFFFDRMSQPKNCPERAQFQALVDTEHWVSCAADEPHALARRLATYNLDVLVDMGGWSDVNGLKALASKPARKLYKWIGGQSFTTGLSVFDGWLTDEAQSKPEHQTLYTEPLIVLPSGYATYTPPASLLPALTPTPNTLGVAANPLKISRAFLGRLIQRLASEPNLTIQFIHKSYSISAAEARIRRLLGAYADRTKFIVPSSHEQYLQCLTGVEAILDTFPYTSGLTALEALYQGIPIITEAGELFCERHGYAHVYYSTQSAKRDSTAHPRINFLQDTARMDHRALADALLTLWAPRN